MNSTHAARDAILVIYTIVVFVFFAVFANPYLEGLSDLRWAADSQFYMKVAQYGSGYVDMEDSQLLNSIGPVLISRLMGNSNLLITLFNYFAFVSSFFMLKSISNVNQIKLLVLMILNPMTLVSITSLNKEIIGFFIVSLFLYLLHEKHRARVLLPLLGLSMLVRWQMAFVMAIFVLFKQIFTCKYWAKSRMMSIALFIAAISFVYPYLRSLGFSESAEAWIPSDVNSAGTLVLLNELQNNYMFFLSCIPKILANLIFFDPLMPARISESFTQYKFYDVYNYWIVPANALMTITALFLSFKSSRPSLLRDSHYFFTIYCIVFSLSPFVQPRYFFPLYALLCVEASVNQKRSQVKA
jgi:hypothetical protein